MTAKTHTRDGRVSAYGFACGIVERMDTPQGHINTERIPGASRSKADKETPLFTVTASSILPEWNGVYRVAYDVSEARAIADYLQSRLNTEEQAFLLGLD